jgi:hypothetical protein
MRKRAGTHDPDEVTSSFPRHGSSQGILTMSWVSAALPPSTVLLVGRSPSFDASRLRVAV